MEVRHSAFGIRHEHVSKSQLRHAMAPASGHRQAYGTRQRQSGQTPYSTMQLFQVRRRTPANWINGVAKALKGAVLVTLNQPDILICTRDDAGNLHQTILIPAHIDTDDILGCNLSA